MAGQVLGLPFNALRPGRHACREALALREVVLLHQIAHLLRDTSTSDVHAHSAVSEHCPVSTVHLIAGCSGSP